MFDGVVEAMDCGSNTMKDFELEKNTTMAEKLYKEEERGGE